MYLFYFILLSIYLPQWRETDKQSVKTFPNILNQQLLSENYIACNNYLNTKVLLNCAVFPDY